MKSNNERMRVSLLALAVQGALIAMCSMPAQADDEEVAALKNPTSTIEIGAENVSQSSAKFGEYTGLNKSGGKVIGNFSIRGGDAYGDGNGTRNWSLNGSNLGTTSRALGASVGNQGSWNFGIGYDELQHNLWDSYKTPYQGAMGGNNFTLPASLLPPTISTVAAGTTPVGTDRASAIAAINAVTNQVDIYSTRKNGKVSAGVNLNAQWDIRFDFNHLEQSGAKLASFGSMGAGGAGNPQGEAISILPNPTNYKTDTLNLALDWRGDGAYVTTSYFGSFFREGYDRVNFQTFAVNNAAGVSVTQTMSTAPSNNFHQLNVSGGYDLSPATKLTGGLSYGRNTQNDAYVADAYSMVLPAPVASLNGLVINKHADMKLTNQTSKDLVLSAGVKFDERRDKTPSNFYAFNALDGSTAHIAYFANTPLSLRKTVWELAGDYKLDSDQHLLLAFNREDVRRWCDQYAVNVPSLMPALVPGATTTGIVSYPAGTNCVVAPKSYDNKLGATYKARASEDLNLNVGYSFSKRVTTSDPNAVTSRIGLNGNLNPALAAATLIEGQNGGDFRGFYPVFDASRKEHMLKAGANWQTTEKLSVSMGGKYTLDKYDSTYGEQKGNSWSVNLDASYGYSENSSVVAYLTQQHRQREMTDLYRSPYLAPGAASATALNIPSGATWTDTQKDDDTTVGVGAKQSGMMASRLELDEDLTYTYGKTVYNTVFNYAAATTTGLTCASPQFLTCGTLPEVNNHVIQLKLSGRYKLDKNSKVAVGYLYQHMRSTDYYYNGLQTGFTPSALMPTDQQSPNYTVNVVSASYIYNF
ncbi:MtrB/PioB family decaheme-associated outer membrane protein [Sideroxydans lithotrophicus]|uniref:Decaheme-associated outer membrane protein, MtrB/PioB family n=1 Tax=Sideroxydans lithotrophicus (strain ES-1) TaxID=580332 RepID=D5CMP9_SIDLE|nr:MtrB/PioB family decaheme-associated outer membrane protein [Sideroxydans lithotrophicus]ADE12721.1 decaheme-associated outer membrane protein, MtrB/PioB family [Sideroxydans lithotrophicus ES-1]